MISAAVPVFARRNPVPAHMFTACGSPARTDAARNGLAPVDLRISQRRLGLMLVDEPVAQPACVAAGKRPRDNGFGESRVLQRGAVHGAAARFSRQQEGRSELRRRSARRHHAPDIVCRHQPAGSHDRHVDGRLHLGQQLVEGLRGRLSGRVERAAMPTRRRTLHRYRVDAAVDRGLRLGQRGDGADDRDAGLAQPPALLGARHAEGERCHVRSYVEQYIDLGGPVVVVESRLTKLRAVTLGLRRERLGVALDISPEPALGCGANRFAPIGPDAKPRAAVSRSANTSAVR